MNAEPGTVLVDITAPGIALVTIAGHDLGARVGREGRGFYVEDDRTEARVATASSYRQAGERFAAHHGVDWPAVVVSNETTGAERTYPR